ncbi:hypothetical protein [Bacillus solitudinis]|uniref:hypothetical protein n=1 Tax=Bacillus solitudinis TaxID=2014074 RepID=UPI000C23F0A6|nr:hypothetical protein [Bacillus solitudinis]
MDVIVKQVAPYPNAPTVIYPVFKQAVIQFFNDDLTDAFQNYNNVASNVFSQVMVKGLLGTSLDCSTDQS